MTTIIDAGQFISQYVRRRLKENGCKLTWSQLKVMRALRDHEGQSQTFIVGETDVDRSTLADVMRRLLREHMITRRRTKEDARAYAVKLTAEGMRALVEEEPVLALIESELQDMAPGMKKASANFIASKQRKIAIAA